MNASSKPDKLPTAARQPACYRRSAAWRAAVDNSARRHALRPKRDTACALNRCAAGSPTPPSNRYCVTSCQVLQGTLGVKVDQQIQPLGLAVHIFQVTNAIVRLPLSIAFPD